MGLSLRIFLKKIIFTKVYNRLKFLQIWQPTAVRHGGRRGPWRLVTNRRFADLATNRRAPRWPPWAMAVGD
jgi:hypothetical protein